MQINEPPSYADDPLHSFEEEQKKKAVKAFWSIVRTLLDRRRFIMGVSIFMAIASVVISLMLPKWYAASTRLLAPESSGTSPISAALLRNLSTAASAILGGASGDFERYISILSSRSVAEKMIAEFDLKTVYETQGKAFENEATRKMLSDNSDFTIDREYGYLSVTVYDKDPERAANMANYYVEELNRVNLELSALSAANYRRFVEERYNETLALLDSTKARLQALQEKHGIFDMESQATGFMEQFAAIRTEEVLLEIQYEALLGEYGPTNPQVSAARRALLAARQKSEEALQGEDSLLPVPSSEMPAVMREYLDIEQEAVIQKNILEVVAPMYEQARFEEEREYEAVQVLDVAIPPERKAKPKRAFVVIGATFTAFLLAVLYVLFSAWWKRNAPSIASNLRPNGNH